MRRHPATVAALVNGLIVWLLPSCISGLSAIGGSLGIGANENAITVHPPGWTPLVPIVTTALRFGVVMLPFAVLAAWRTWVHARRRLEFGTSGWQGVGEAGALGLATLLVLMLPGILRHPIQALPYILVYGALAALIGLLVGLLLRISALAALKMTVPTARMSLLTMIVIVLLTPPTDAAQVSRGAPPAAETYQSATIDGNGHLVIVKTGGQTVVVRKEGEQTAFSGPVVSSARTAVAAQAMFGNCCTSYDIPLQLVVYAGGKAHRFDGDGLAIFQWGFADSGAKIAYGQEPVHFGCETHYELRDVQSERLIEEVDIPQPCGQIPNPRPVKIPEWVARLISGK